MTFWYHCFSNFSKLCKDAWNFWINFKVFMLWEKERKKRGFTWSSVHHWWWGIGLFLVGISILFKLVNLVLTTVSLCRLVFAMFVLLKFEACLLCNLCYIGATMRCLLERFREHLKPFQPVGKHARNCNVLDQMVMKNVKILASTTCSQARGGSGVIFACLVHVKVSFIAEQLFLRKRRYRAVSKSFWALKVGRRTSSLQKYMEGVLFKIWSFCFIFFCVLTLNGQKLT